MDWVGLGALRQCDPAKNKNYFLTDIIIWYVPLVGPMDGCVHACRHGHTAMAQRRVVSLARLSQQQSVAELRTAHLQNESE